MKKTHKKTKFFIFLLTVTLTLVSFKAYFYIHKKESEQFQSNHALTSLGGEVKLIDQDNQSFSLLESNKDLTLVFFGFTNCPSFCPIAINSISNYFDLLDVKDSKKVSALFITVDPERDSPEAMKDFLSNFNNNIIGLTGKENDIKETVKKFKVYSNKVEEGEEAMAHGGYIMDHSTYIYLVDAKGHYLTHFQYDVDPNFLLEEINKKYLR